MCFISAYELVNCRIVKLPNCRIDKLTNSFFWSDDQSQRRIIGDEWVEPTESQFGFVAETNQWNDVYEKPYKPGQESFEWKFGKVGNSFVFGDDGHAAFVHIDEGPYRLFGDELLQVVGQQFTLLYGNLCQLRMPVGILRICILVTNIADGKNVYSAFYFIECIYEYAPASSCTPFG